MYLTKPFKNYKTIRQYIFLIIISKLNKCTQHITECYIAVNFFLFRIHKRVITNTQLNECMYIISDTLKSTTTVSLLVLNNFYQPDIQRQICFYTLWSTIAFGHDRHGQTMKINSTL